MNEENKNNNETQPKMPIESYNPADRDFQRTEEDLDNVSKSEKEELEKRKERTHKASTTPDKDHIGG